MDKLIDVTDLQVRVVLPVLLRDKTTKRNIIWATDTYTSYGDGYFDKQEITVEKLLSVSELIKPRILKSLEEQHNRTKKKAEVFTPAWLCNKMNNYNDEEWFGRKNVFNVECDDHQWDVVDNPVSFPEKSTRDWKHYVDSRRLEITCGEAPFLVSRYNADTGGRINPTFRRIGILDRKLRVVNENTSSREDWLKWAIRAFESVYGYEYQGDSLLIARINLFLTFIDYYRERWNEEPDMKLLKTVANKIAWNLWQMDGFKDTVPLGMPPKEVYETNLFDAEEVDDTKEEEAPYCKIQDWRNEKKSIVFDKIKGRLTGMKFDYVIGNPPYQEENLNNGRKTPIYNIFMESSYDLAKAVELITPARFLFKAGQTPRAWNEKMLNDSHFKVISYESDASKVFPNTDIKGGVVITYRDVTKNFGKIKIFTKFIELNAILEKILQKCDQFLMNIVSTRGCYRFSEQFYKDYPEALDKVGKGTGNMIVSNIFEKVPTVFLNQPLKKEIILS